MDSGLFVKGSFRRRDRLPALGLGRCHRVHANKQSVTRTVEQKLMADKREPNQVQSKLLLPRAEHATNTVRKSDLQFSRMARRRGRAFRWAQDHFPFLGKSNNSSEARLKDAQEICLKS